MNFDQPMPPRPRTFPRADTPPQQPLSQPPPQPPAEGGVDPAALIAARTAAVARNRQREARAAMVRDVLRIIFVGVIIGGVAWVGLRMHRHRMEEERLRIEAEQRAQEERAKEQREREERFAAERAAQREKAEAEAAEKRRREEERQEKLKRQEEERQRIESNKKRYKTVLDRFKGRTLDQFSAVPRNDHPEHVTGETMYSCVMPIGSKGMTFYEMKALPGKDILVTRLDEEGTRTDIPYAEFSILAKQNPFLLAKGTYCYYKGRNWEMRVPVPSANEKVDPSRNDFRDLYGFAATQCNKQPALAYEVFFVDAGLEMRVHVVPFGQTFSRADVKKGLQQIAESGTGRGRTGNATDLEARLNKGSLVIRRKGSSR